MAELIGILLSVFAGFFFGTYFVPMKKIKDIDLYQYQFFAGIGILLVGIASLFIFNISFEINAGIITGIMWAIANLLAANALKHVGMSKFPLAQATVVLVSFLWGVVFFQEPFQSVLLAIVGILFLILGIPLIAVSEDRSKTLTKGFVLLFLAGIIWGSTFVVPLLLKIEVNKLIFPISLGAFLSGVLLLVIKGLKFEMRTAYTSIFSGMLWSIGNVASVLALGIIGLALAGPLSQVAILFSVGWGLFYFKDVKTTSKTIKIIIGGIMLVLGAILLAVSK